MLIHFLPNQTSIQRKPDAQNARKLRTSSTTLKPEKTCILGDALLYFSNAGAVLNDVEFPYVQFPTVILGYVKDQFFGPVLQALHTYWPKSATRGSNFKADSDVQFAKQTNSIERLVVYSSRFLSF